MERGDLVEIKRDACATVVDTVPIDRVGLRLIELGSEETFSARCPHCGATNLFRGYTVIEAFISSVCSRPSSPITDALYRGQRKKDRGRRVGRAGAQH